MKRFFQVTIVVLSIALGLFLFIKASTKHFLSPCKVYGPESTIPLEYQQVISGMCNSGMLVVIGFFQVLSGILLVIPRTRLIGAIVLLPIIFNIFLLHYFLDNRPHELVETGIPLAATILIIGYYYPKWKKIFILK